MTAAAPYRITGPRAAALGSELDRERALRFRFDEQSFVGCEGDSLASALLANGVRTVGRSFKFHRPRGVYASGWEEPNALVQLETRASTVPSARSTLIELYEGLEAFSHSGWPSLRVDFGRVLDFIAPLWAAGFYNKTFMWPSWHTYEGLVRRMAGFGHVPREPDPDRYEIRNLHCEVLVIGGGEKGLRAATEAAQGGSRVVLAEQGAKLGGRGAWDGSSIDGIAAASWVRTAAERLAGCGDVRILSRTTAVGYYESDVVTLLETLPIAQVREGAPRERYWVVRAKRVIMAAGATEQPLIFCNNDRPGILLAGAAHQYLRRYSVAVGRRVVVATNNDSAYAVARDLKEAGIDVLAIADTRREVSPSLIEEMRAAAIPLLTESIPVDTGGFGALASVKLGRLSRDAKSVDSVQSHACDALAISGGWNPNLHLYSQARARLTYSDTAAVFEASGSHPVARLASGTAQEVGAKASASPSAIGIRVSPVGNTARQWVDLRHDVTVADIELALRENYSSIEHVKRYTTVGMSVDQGKTSHLAALDVVARLRGARASDLGHTTLRPPFVPVSLGAIVGRATGGQFAPSRLLPMHQWHHAHGAVLELFGSWKRPAVYLRAGESRAEGIRREALAVRNAAGLFDGSPLGKIEVQGPDALEFLDRFYINNLATLKPGRARYGLMLRETGAIFDDGTVVMLAPDRLLITTTSANAARVSAWLEEWHQCEWPQLRVALTAVTEQWATVSLAGPRAREILSKLDCDIDLSSAAFPHLGMREGRLLGHPVRIYRVSFTGELTYEINIPTGAGQGLWDALIEVGSPLGLQPLGLDALLLLRLEKGFLHVGSDTDGTTVPDDVGWGKVAAAKGADYIGKRSLSLPEHVRPDRLQLIGLTSEVDIPIGSHLRLPGSTEGTDGWVTSTGRMALTSQPIALALLKAGRSQVGASVNVHDAAAITRAQVVNPPFFDPTGERMNA